MAVSQSGEQEAAERTEAPEQEPAAQAGRVRVLDFSVPTKFTPEIRRRLLAAIEDCCESLAATLAGELAVEVELAVGEVQQQTWAAARAGLAADSIAVELKTRPSERQMLMSAELPLVSQALECLLGGRAAEAPDERHMSDVDWVLTKGLFDRIAGELSRAFEELAGCELSRGELDIEGDAGVAVAAGEPTLAVAITSSIEAARSSLSLLLPWSAVEPLISSLRGSAPAQAEPISAGADQLRRGLARADVLVRAEVGSVQMPIERMLELLPGTVVTLDERAEDGVVLFAEEVSIGRGRPGRSGTRRAVKLEATGEPPTRAATYAKLGRAELERARAHAREIREGRETPGILRSIFVRVWAELGRTHMPLGGALELTAGGVVELDQGAESPVELFANGLCFANGSLVVTAEGGWGVQVDALV